MYILYPHTAHTPHLYNRGALTSDIYLHGNGHKPNAFFLGHQNTLWTPTRRLKHVTRSFHKSLLRAGSAPGTAGGQTQSKQQGK